MAETEQTINLKVLSPSAELEGGVTLADIPASTTVKELRSRIQNAVPSKPAPERMRLIYRGRVVANDADTLNTVFGADNIRESKDQSLHLVIRELPPHVPSPAPRPSTVPPNPLRPEAPEGPVANPLQTNPFRVLPQTRPTSQPQIAPPQLPPHRLPEQVNAIALPLPIPLHRPFAQAVAHEGQRGDEQPSNRTSEQSRQGTQGAGDVAHPPPPETAPLPPMGLPNLPGNGDQPIRREGVTPNGARWTFTTYNQVNIPARIPQPVVPFPVPHAIAFGRPPLSIEDQRLLPRVQRIFLETKREIENIRMLLRLPGNSDSQAGGLLTSNMSSSLSIPAWRIERLRQHLNTVNQNLNVVDRALALLPTEPEVTALRRSATELRVDAVELSIMLDRQQEDAPDATSETAPGVPTTAPAAPNTSHVQAREATQTIPADVPAELFLLSSPQGPVGVLFDQQGTYTTAPMAPTLPFQTFSSQFAQNRQLLADLGQRLAHGTNQLHNQLANMQPTPTGQPAAAGQPQDQNQAQNQAQNQNQNGNQNGPQLDENDRMNNIAGHLWLIFKLAIFVYVFAGSGGFYRPAMLGAVAGFVYLAQIGMFEDQFNFVRRHFEALLPVGAMAEHAAQPNGQRPRGNISPEEAARRLLQRRQDERFGWIRDSLRGIERAFTLFIASLFPGVGERMVHAQEERERLERVAAEEERQRQEEEARKREEEAQREAQQQQQNNEKSIDATVGEEGEPSSSNSSKGKEKADEAQTDISASPS